MLIDLHILHRNEMRDSFRLLDPYIEMYRLLIALNEMVAWVVVIFLQYYDIYF